MNHWAPEREIGGRDPSFFGLRVHPVTLGHLRLLHDIGAAMPPESVADALMIAFVCSCDHIKSRKHITAIWCKVLLRWLAYRCGRKGLLKKQAEAFGDWLEYQLTGPSQKIRSKPGEKLSTRYRLAAPIHITTIASLMGCLGLSLEEAEAMPVRFAKQLLASYHEASGNIELWTDDDYAFEERCKQADARKRGMTPANN
jgi:hypothetical protein